MPPGVTARIRAARKRQQSKVDGPVYAAVDRRDGLQSRCSRIYGGASIHRHHIVFRSQGGKTTTANVISLTQKEHEQVHAGLLDIRTRDLPCLPPMNLGADGLVDFFERRTISEPWEWTATT